MDKNSTSKILKYSCPICACQGTGKNPCHIKREFELYLGKKGHWAPLPESMLSCLIDTPEECKGYQLKTSKKTAETIAALIR
jgi:hypothetical protein